ncbi:peptidylprolyl isomerase [Sarracenia purpurea var. burkii]
MSSGSTNGSKRNYMYQLQMASASGTICISRTEHSNDETNFIIGATPMDQGHLDQGHLDLQLIGTKSKSQEQNQPGRVPLHGITRARGYINSTNDVNTYFYIICSLNFVIWKWVEVKPGKPFNHSFDRVRGRLHISQATLGIGSSPKKSLVQCNVGDKSPVFLCALLPDKTESCHLDLEFEEGDEVLFSVIGPRSVHLTGYYLGNGRHSNINDDTDSYGEDIANTETEESARCSDEDEYEDSFIDDDNPEVCPSSPVSNDGVVDEDMLDNEKTKERKFTRKRLKKKYQAIESDDDNNSQQKKIVNECQGISGIESEDEEDNFPISSFCKSRTEGGDKIYKETSKTNKKTAEDDGLQDTTEDKGTRVINPTNEADVIDVVGQSKSSLPCFGVGPEDGFKMTKERRERSSEGKTRKAGSVNCCNALKEDKLQHTEEKTDKIGEGLSVKNTLYQKPATDKEPGLSNHSLPPNDADFKNHVKSKKKRKDRTEEGKTLESDGINHRDAPKVPKALQDKTGDRTPGTDKETDWLPPSNEVGSESSAKPKKRRKECAAEEKPVEGSTNYINVVKEDEKKHNEIGSDKSTKDHPVKGEQDQKFSNVRGIDIDSNQVANGYQPENVKAKKKKKNKVRENKGNLDADISSLAVEESNGSIMRFENNNSEAKSCRARTLSNGLIIEELETGKPDGKLAAPGKKVKIHYIAKLRENGKIVDSNIGKDPVKFRLGAEDVLEEWNIGLDGMRVGDKRRIVVPPSMGYGSRGAGENIPPNSWLVYEVELVGVR